MSWCGYGSSSGCLVMMRVLISFLSDRKKRFRASAVALRDLSASADAVVVDCASKFFGGCG